MRGFVLSVGDELTSGVTVDTNSAWLSQRLAEAGIRVIGHATVGDDQTAIEEAIRAAKRWADLLVITGGIGPTPDDLTREAVAAVIDEPLVEHPDWTRHMAAYFQERGRVMQPGNLKQATIPRGAKILWNPIGTAAGIAADVDRGLELVDGDCRVFVLPGVPAEMRAMFDEHVQPWAMSQSQRSGGRVMRVRALHTFGIGESDLAARLGDLLRRREESEGLQVGTTASGGIVSIRVYATAATHEDARAMLDEIERRVREKLGALIFGRDDQALAGVVGELLRSDPRRPLLRVAESCTGGLLAKLLTDVPGSSDYFDRGLVTYSNQAKQALLGVPPELIEAHGAVSEPVVAAMARGALAAGGIEPERAGIALSISGIAGPGGGSRAKPVGTVCIGLAWIEAGGALPGGQARTFRFVGDRDLVRQRSALMALTMLRYHLLGTALPF